ncbi:DUF4114 domain-containing protein [Fodinicurvata sp. EGI_FJ10296]|uniref:DUF4114 domain-containing protein n=1 Tax=Fodinicurvata sp. EGI_FJ10296 TaxID=3231908 RepID=UPI00345163CA
MAEQQDGAQLTDDVINDELTALSRAALKPAAETNDAGGVSVSVNDARLETLQVLHGEDPDPAAVPAPPEGVTGSATDTPTTARGAGYPADPLGFVDPDLGAAVGGDVGTGARFSTTTAPGLESGIESGIEPGDSGTIDTLTSAARESENRGDAGRSGAAASNADLRQDSGIPAADVPPPAGTGPDDGPNTPADGSAAVPDRPQPDAAAAVPELPGFDELPALDAPGPVPVGPDALGETTLSGLDGVAPFAATVASPAVWTPSAIQSRSFSPSDLEIADLPSWQATALSVPDTPDLFADSASAPDYGMFAIPALADGPAIGLAGAGQPVQMTVPDAPDPVAFRPEINASSGLIVFDSAGEMLNPPDESETWEYLDPFSGERSHVNPEYINGTKKINNLSLEQDFPVSVTFVGEGAGHKNALGYYKIGEDGTISDVSMIWENASGANKADVLKAWQDQGADADQLAAINRIYGGINQGGDLVPGQSTVELANLSAGDSFGFFLVSNGNNNRDFREAMESGRAALSFRDADGNPAKVSGEAGTPRLTFDYVDDHGNARSGTVSNDVFHTAANGDTLGLNTSNKQQAMSGVVGEDRGELDAWGVDTGELLIGFEDLARPGGDSDFNDLVFRLNVDPVFIENLETVSTSPRVSLGHGDDGDTLNRAVVTFDQLDGAVFGFDGWNGTDSEGVLQVDGHDVAFVVDRAADGESATVEFSTAGMAPPSVFESLLDSVEIDTVNADGDTLTEGDRLVGFQVSGQGGDSDIVQSVVRVAHNPDDAVNAPSPTVIRTGPSNIEIAAEHDAAMAAWAAEKDRVEAGNDEIADAHGAVADAMVVADEAFAAYDAAHTGLTEAADAADAAIDAALGAWDVSEERAAAMETAHEQVSAAQSDVADAVNAHEAAVAVADAAHDRVADVREQAEQAIDTISTLEADARTAHDAAVAAEGVYDDAVRAVDTAEAQTATALTAAEDARSAALSARDAAMTARQAAETKADEIASARAELATLVDEASATQASIVEATDAADGDRQSIESMKATVGELQDAVGQAHGALARDPGRSDLQARYEQTIEAHDEARASLDEAVGNYNADLGRIEALNEALADQKAGIAGAEDRLAALVDDYEGLAAEAHAANAAFEAAGQQFSAADADYTAAQQELAATRAQADAAGDAAEEAWSDFGQASGAYDQAVAVFENAVVPAYEAVTAEFEAAAAAADGAADAVAAARSDFDEALAAYQEAEDAYAGALEDYRAAADAADADVDSVRAAALMADSAYEGYRDAMADAADAADAYADTVVEQGGEAPEINIAVPPETDAYKAASIIDDTEDGDRPFPDAPANDGTSDGGSDDGAADDLFTFDDGGGDAGGGDAGGDDPVFDGIGGDDGSFDCDPTGLETCV